MKALSSNRIIGLSQIRVIQNPTLEVPHMLDVLGPILGVLARALDVAYDPIEEAEGLQDLVLGVAV